MAKAAGVDLVGTEGDSAGVVGAQCGMQMVHHRTALEIAVTPKNSKEEAL